ncbi:DUF3551 domain-containing protein [Afipia sp. P52-10]|uniref:DUF3551 domain-containing protein n=1 Tax=Afipia sp. P52-10 TaxID=1429916 RepID=UPI0009DDE653
MCIRSHAPGGLSPVLSAFLAAAFGAVVIPGARAEMPPFRYCMIGTPNMGTDCTFNNLEQCRMTASGGIGFCTDNPAYTARMRIKPDGAPPQRRSGR